MRPRAAWIAAAVLWASPGLRGGEPPPDSGEIVEISNIVYGIGGGEELLLDLARPKGPGRHPGIICIHGGGWAAGKRQDFKFLINLLARKGYVAVTASYRFAPAHLFPAQIEDVKCAVRWMRAHADLIRLDPARIGAVGGSAGGHLSLLLGSADGRNGLEGTGGWPGESSRVQAVVNIFGPTDLAAENFGEASRKILANFLGGPLEGRRELRRRASPVAYLTRDDPPVLTFHGTADPLVPLDQAEVLHRWLAELGIENRLVILEGRGHGWGGADMERTLQDTVAFFDRQLKGRRIDRL